MADELAPYSAHITHRVDDADRWKAGFDDLEDARRTSGILGHHILRAVDDPQVITVFLALTHIDEARACMASYECDEVMQRMGVVSQPAIEWLRPIRAGIVTHRQLPAFLLRRRVSDVDAWLADYAAAGDRREVSGIIGHAVECSIDDPASVVVYQQAERSESLHRHLADPEMSDVFVAGGEDAEPVVSFHTGGWTKTYQVSGQPKATRGRP